ncbi:MAG: heparinase II/III family protein [Verrucomicrobiales bacterium]|nr:heparinase II/III family protein [Verrucomicrobiales bacterium]
MKTTSLSPIPVAALLATTLAVTRLPAAAPVYPPQVEVAEVRAAVDAASRTHPRLFVSANDLRALRTPFPDGSLKRALADHIVQTASQLEGALPVTRTLEGRRLLGQSRRCIERVLMLATAFHLTGDDRFARRAEQEMLAAAAFDDWNPSHFLDVAEMTMALGLGYDWLFDALSPESRATIREAIIEKGVKLPFETRHNGWVRARNNWGQVCHGGLTIGALAVLEDEPALAARTVHNALMNVTVSMAAFAPKGSYPEGPGYWAYGTTYNVLLIDALERVLGSDFGLSQAPGFALTGQYPALVTGPSGSTFNYADGGSGRGPEPALFWFARRYQRPDWIYEEPELLRRRMASGGRFLPLTLFWMEEPAPQSPIAMPLHWYSDGPVPVSVHRSSWTDPHRVFLGFKGGSPSANHGQMDTGSFVLDADGVRWALDLGAEGYHGIESRGMNLWNSAQDSDRWTIFRQMNLGHNTLVIDGQLQKAAGTGKFIAFSEDPAFPHAIIDLTGVYEGQAASVRRGVALLPSRGVLIQDELSGLRPGAKVRWGMITPGQPGDPGRGEIRLQQDGRTLDLSVLSPGGVAWEIYDSATPRNEWDSPNRGTVMAQFEAVAPADGRLRLAVLAVPGTATRPGDSEVKQAALADW